MPAHDQLTLDAETTYYVLIYHADDDDGGVTVTVDGVVTTRFGIIIDRTYSKSEDSGAATGWSIGNRRYYKVRYGDSWSVNIIRFAKIVIRGTRLLSDDATLSDLSLSHGSITVPLNRAFDAATTQYTASVAYGVSSLTVTPTTNEMNATVGYFDASDTDLDDADANTPDHQVNLEEGSNTLKVKVTADDGNTTETYTVVVTRERPTVPEAPEDLGATAVSPTRIYLYWTAPSNFVNSGITGYQYRMSTDGGHTWSRQWRDIHGSGKRTDITEHTVHWLDSANEYTFQVRAENALGGGISASVKARPGKPAVSRPKLTIEKVTGKDNVNAGKRDATKPVQQGSLVNGVFVGNGTYWDACHEDAFAHYRIRATGGDHLWRPGSQFRGVSVGVEYVRAGRNNERSSSGVSSSVTGLVGRIAGSIVPGTGPSEVMIVFAVTATRNQLCPSRSIREAPSSRFSMTAPMTSRANSFVASRTRNSTSSGASGHGSERNCSCQTATTWAAASTTRGGRPERSMDEGAGGGDTGMGMLPMLGFETRHRTASGGAERSHLPLLDTAVVTKSCPGTAHCHE